MRDYYGIKNAPKDDNAPSTTGSNVSAGTTRDDDDDDGSSLGISVLDKDDFDAQDYVGNLLAHENLQVVLKAERRLLDGTFGFYSARMSAICLSFLIKSA